MAKKSSVDIVTGEIISPRVRHPLHRHAVVSKCGGPSKTQQSHKELCCINRIMSSVDRTNSIPPDPYGRIPNYGDVSHLNLPLDQLIAVQRETESSLIRYSDEQKEKIRLDRIAKRKKLVEEAKAYRDSLAAVDKNKTTAADSSVKS